MIENGLDVLWMGDSLSWSIRKLDSVSVPTLDGIIELLESNADRDL